MFVITRRLGKVSGDRRLSDSDMPPAKAQRRQVRREKTNILTKDFHVFSPTFAALASLREIFRVSVTVVRRRRTSFSQPSLGKSVSNRKYYLTTKARRPRRFRRMIFLNFLTSCSSCLRGEISFHFLVAASPRWVLRGGKCVCFFGCGSAAQKKDINQSAAGRGSPPSSL